ncbi:MAG: large subunit ribosomal protein L22 [Candidatus Paceibacteria bacterium]|jgi:large subunit ribosomal protein L22
MLLRRNQKLLPLKQLKLQQPNTIMSFALLKNYRQSSRKVRLVADSVRGKKVNQALVILDFTPKRAAKVVSKVVKSALANAKHNYNLNEEDLFVKEISVNEGITMKRYRMRARGSVSQIRKRTSHIKVILGEIEGGKTVVVEEKKEETPEVEKVEKKAEPKKKVTKVKKEDK